MAEFNIAEIDTNLAVAEKLNTPDLVLYDVRKAPFQIYGLYEPQTEPVFKRMPSDVAETVNEGVKICTCTPREGACAFRPTPPTW